jgi:2-methylcitrate synthase
MIPGTSLWFPVTHKSSNSMSDPNASSTGRGLEGVVALDSKICDIDGGVGRLVYAGYEIDDLARHTTFEDVVHLLWSGELPAAGQRQDLLDQLARTRTLPPSVVDLIDAAPTTASPMAVLRTAVSALGQLDPEADDPSVQANKRKAIRLTARMTTVVASIARTQAGKSPIAPNPELGAAANFLYMLDGRIPGPQAARIFDACLVLHAEHGLNASTFAARVIAATMADMYGAVSGAIAALQGPLHGGANLKVKLMLDEIRASGSDPTDFVMAKLAKKERIMGFGHRVYKTVDPRATYLREVLADLSAEKGDTSWLTLSTTIMEIMSREKKLYPNVDFFSASVYALLDIPGKLFTPIFAMSRIAGWTAHLLEQWDGNRLIRPRAAYVGPADRKVARG